MNECQNDSTVACILGMQRLCLWAISSNHSLMLPQPWNCHLGQYWFWTENTSCRLFSFHRWVDVKHCDCPNGQLPSWHRRKRRQVTEECRSLEEKHNKFVEGWVCFRLFGNSTQWIQGKVANLERKISVHCTILLDHAIKMMTSCFDTDFVSKMSWKPFP